MSVVVLYRDEDTYRLSGDGRVTAGDIIYTEFSPKVYSTATGDVIYGIVGNCSDTLILQDAIERYCYDPIALHSHLNSEEVIKHLASFEAIYMTEDNSIYVVSLELIKQGDSTNVSVALTKIESTELPYFLGSGSTELRPLFLTLSTYTKRNVEKVFKLAYKVNNSIGGHILHKEMPVNESR